MAPIQIRSHFSASVERPTMAHIDNSFFENYIMTPTSFCKIDDQIGERCKFLTSVRKFFQLLRFIQIQPQTIRIFAGSTANYDQLFFPLSYNGWNNLPATNNCARSWHQAFQKSPDSSINHQNFGWFTFIVQKTRWRIESYSIFDCYSNKISYLLLSFFSNWPDALLDSFAFKYIYLFEVLYNHLSQQHPIRLIVFKRHKANPRPHQFLKILE